MGLAVQAKKQLELDKVVFIPAKYQPFKLNREFASDEHRVNMLKEAIKEYDNYFEVYLLCDCLVSILYKNKIGSSKAYFSYSFLKHCPNCPSAPVTTIILKNFS